MWHSQTCMDCCQREHNNKWLLLQQTAAVHHRSTKCHSLPALLHTTNKLRAQNYMFKDSQQLNSGDNYDSQLVSQSTQVPTSTSSVTVNSGQHRQLVSQSAQVTTPSTCVTVNSGHNTVNKCHSSALALPFMSPVSSCSDHLPVCIYLSICSAAVAPGHHGAAVAIMSGGGSVKGLARLVQVRLVITPFACS